jgi:hypothetical protein
MEIRLPPQAVHVLNFCSRQNPFVLVHSRHLREYATPGETLEVDSPPCYPVRNRREVVKRSNTLGGSMPTISDVVHQLETQRKRTQRELEKLNLAIKALTSLSGKSVSAGIRRKPHFSAAAIARIRAAQKARWAKIRAAQKK